MHSTLIVARMSGEHEQDIAKLFGAFDQTEMPELMGTLRRQLFTFNGLYFHLQDFGSEGSASIDRARSHPLFQQISADMRPFVEAYDPATWRSPADAIATRFYRWERQA
ncbi:TcmI family type II polyketide cyclase [Nocardiopsis alborubida]|uniref:TcmI family type II polyketide cyclase n=2 Tax=Nocardiopsis TaxID=2013 RepID=A0A7X6M9L0_9ACTN|nr:TcmI family type II polyketide cyclase [Nocardiopsis alborubida]NKY97182.1 TcmI family type II polyketide cyclase [Nocardiopsis alborubida]QOP59269.1 polyketide synthesis cyclase [Nocardiopsis sp.]